MVFHPHRRPGFEVTQYLHFVPFTTFVSKPLAHGARSYLCGLVPGQLPRFAFKAMPAYLALGQKSEFNGQESAGLALFCIAHKWRGHGTVERL